MVRRRIIFILIFLCRVINKPSVYTNKSLQFLVDYSPDYMELRRVLLDIKVTLFFRSSEKKIFFLYN